MRRTRNKAGSTDGYGQRLIDLQGAFVGEIGERLAQYCNGLHRQREDAHGGSWTYGSPKGVLDWLEIRVWSQSQAPLPIAPNLLVRVQFLPGANLDVRTVLDNQTDLLSRDVSPKSSPGSIAIDCGEAYERALIGANRNRVGRRIKGRK